MSSITITASQLRDLTKPLLPIARLGGESSPMLGAIRFEVFGDELVCSVTDRFRLGLTRQKVTPGDFAANIDHVDLARVLSILKPSRDTDPDIMLEVEGDRLHVSHAGGLFDSLKMTFRLVEGDRPNLYKLLLAKLAAEPAPAEARVNATFLAQFADAKRSHSDVMDIAVTSGPGEVVIVRVGDHFIGVLMPMRRGTHNHPIDWTAVLAAPAKAGA